MRKITISNKKRDLMHAEDIIDDDYCMAEFEV